MRSMQPILNGIGMMGTRIFPIPRNWIGNEKPVSQIWPIQRTLNGTGRTSNPIQRTWNENGKIWPSPWMKPIVSQIGNENANPILSVSRNQNGNQTENEIQIQSEIPTGSVIWQVTVKRRFSLSPNRSFDGL